MTEEQFAELYAMNLFNQEEVTKMLEPEYERRCWHLITKKERNKYRKLADEILEEIQ